MVKVDQIKSEIIFDSRQKETIEVTLFSGKNKAQSSVPSGESKGLYEAVSLPPREAQKKVLSLAASLSAKAFSDPLEFDQFLLSLDGTNNKQNLGANTTLALSIAFWRLYSQLNNLPLYKILGEKAEVSQPSFPRFFSNLIEGGLHVDPKYHPLPFQEYLVVPQSQSPSKSLQMIINFINQLKLVLQEEGIELYFGDEGGFIVPDDDPEKGFRLLLRAAALLNQKQGENFSFALDAASSSFWNQDKKLYIWNNLQYTTLDLQNLYQSFLTRYPLLSLEDPFQQEDWGSWASFKKTVSGETFWTSLKNTVFRPNQESSSLWIMGDDLTVTNTQRMEEAKKKNCLNAVIIKPNQIGTVGETIKAIKLAKKYHWKIIISHRGRETMDSFIADLSFGVGADGIKAGSPLQKERLVKYQRLIEIEKALV